MEQRKGIDRRLFLCLLACWLLLVLGCCTACAPSQEPLSQVLLTASPQAVSAWPHNVYTQQIPQPAQGRLTQVYDLSTAGRYALCFAGITQEGVEQYLLALQQQGYLLLAEEDNSLAAGLLLQRAEVVLSLAYSGDIMQILIYAPTAQQDE